MPEIIQVSVSRGGVPKRAIPQVMITSLGLEGDSFAHPNIHGGPNQRVLIIVAEVIDDLVARGFPVFYDVARRRRPSRPHQNTQALRHSGRLPQCRRSAHSGRNLQCSREGGRSHFPALGPQRLLRFGAPRRDGLLGSPLRTSVRIGLDGARASLPYTAPRPAPFSSLVFIEPSFTLKIPGNLFSHSLFAAGKYCREFASIAATGGTCAARLAD